MTALFITFEGLDGSGKSTHLREAFRWLEDNDVECQVAQEPGGTPLGEAIREMFLDPRWGEIDGTVEALLVFASRRQHLLEVIEPALAEGRHVICDRFTDSTFAYQGYGRGVPISILREVDRLATGGRVPDRTLLFDLPAEVARQRGHSEARRESQEGVTRLDAEALEFYGKVRQGYLELAQEFSDRFVVIRSAGTFESTREQVRSVLSEIFRLEK
ncbi:MAG: dTMP kinase [Thermoanaerobaculia bacterium]